MLGRSLTDLHALVDRALSQVRLGAGELRRERLGVAAFFDEIAATGVLHAEYRHVRFTVDPVAPDLAAEGEPQLLMSAVMNLLHNAFKNTPPGGAVVLRAHTRDQRVIVEIQDECGGIPESRGDLFQPFGERRGRDRSGLGLGLSITRSAVRAHGGDVIIRNMPGKGCVFAIDVPLAAADANVAYR